MKKRHPFYGRAAWKRARRARLLMDHYQCTECLRLFREGKGGKPRPATTVHHVIPLRERPDLALDLDNLQSLCDACHNRMHPEKRQHGAPVAEAPARRARVLKI